MFVRWTNVKAQEEMEFFNKVKGHSKKCWEVSSFTSGERRRMKQECKILLWTAMQWAEWRWGHSWGEKKKVGKMGRVWRAKPVHHSFLLGTSQGRHCLHFHFQVKKLRQRNRTKNITFTNGHVEIWKQVSWLRTQKSLPLKGLWEASEHGVGWQEVGTRLSYWRDVEVQACVLQS